MRLNAFLARAGVASRRKADELIKAGRVRVNGEPGQLEHVRRRRRPRRGRRRARRAAAARLRPPAQAGRRRHDGERPAGRPTVVELVEPASASCRSAASTPTRPARSLLTNDGALAHRLAHPRYEVDKVYEAEVEGSPSTTTLVRGSREGVELEDGRTAPARVRRLGPSRIELIAPRGTQAPGEADVRGGRPSVAGSTAAATRGSTLAGLEAGRVAGADARRGRGLRRAQRRPDEAHALVHRRERRAPTPPRAFSAPTREQAPQLGLVGAQLA